MIPWTLIAVAVVAGAAFGLGLFAVLRGCRYEDVQPQPLPPAKLPGAGRLHAAMPDGTRLCSRAGGLATQFWTVVDCKACTGTAQYRRAMEDA